MKNVYVLIGLGVSLVASVVVAFIFFDFWKQEESRVIGLEKEKSRLERQIKALETNKDEVLLAIGEEYVKKVFTYTQNDHDRGLDVMGEFYSEAYKNKLKKLNDNHEEEGVGAVGSSRVNILESNYNKHGAEEAKVVVSFEQITSLDGIKTKVLYDIALEMVYMEDGWKINDMKLIEKI